eukprot:m.81663 g.81663  ORF g.81663 m.81663 type:complete len:341 (-) comp14700_c0_seq3:100-1122(-)
MLSCAWFATHDGGLSLWVQLQWLMGTQDKLWQRHLNQLPLPRNNSAIERQPASPRTAIMSRYFACGRRQSNPDEFDDRQHGSNAPPPPTAATSRGALIERQGSDGFIIVDQARQIGDGWQSAAQPPPGSASCPAAPSATAPPTTTDQRIARAASFAQSAVFADQHGDKTQARLLYEQAALLLEEAASLCESKDLSEAEMHMQRAKEYAIRAHQLTPPGERSGEDQRVGARQPKLVASDPAQLEARGDRLLKQARSEHEERNFFEAKQLYAQAARCFAAASTGAGDETAKVILSRKAREAQQAATGIAQAMGTAPAAATPHQPAGVKIAPCKWAVRSGEQE